MKAKGAWAKEDTYRLQSHRYPLSRKLWGSDGSHHGNGVAHRKKLHRKMKVGRSIKTLYIVEPGL